MNNFYNLIYGKCVIIYQSEDLYLVQVEKNNSVLGNFIVCTYIDEMGAMLNQKFFKNVFEAKKYYDDKKANNSKIR